MQEMMLQNISFFGRYKEQIQKLDKGKCRVIKEGKVFGEFSTWQEASLKGMTFFGEDSFLIKYCT